MEVAEVFLGAFLQVLLDRLAFPKLLEFATREGIRSRLDKLKDNLHIINPVITDAENMLVREAGVNEWLGEVKDWAYDADDFLDEVSTRAMQEEEKVDEARRNNTSSSISVYSWVSNLASGFNSGKYSKNVDELNRRLDVIFERMRKMHRKRKFMKMFASDITSTPAAKGQRPLEATGHEFDARVVGREQEKERIIEQLKSSMGANVEVIPIVGMPGIGKTTLARHVYESVQQQEPLLFDIKGWVCVSDDYDVNRITRDILESFDFRTYDSWGRNQLQSKVKELVRGKRFLLVLDDVWSRNYPEHWGALRSPFGVGAPGSKILVTTRDLRVASVMQTDDPGKIHSLGILLDNDCWSVFLQHVVDQRSSVFESEAVRFRDKILDKCKGLPLTAKLLAGLLRDESPGPGWEAILNSGIWNVEYPGRKGYPMLPGVMLSYFHLPPHLRPCFSYCAVFPEDHEFDEEAVVMMWIAQGLVLPEGDKQIEVTGANYFRELVSRSLFQPSPNNPSLFLMHDLIINMAEIVAGKSCLKVDGVPKIDSSCVKARYSSYRNFSGLKTEFESFERTICLRGFQSFRPSSYLTSYVPMELLMKLKCLRILRLSTYYITELPENIGDLIHLRLVDLSQTAIRELPESTSNLYNLLALKLRRCNRLTKLPAQMRKLVNLRNLDCSGSNDFVAMPVEMGKLTSLQKLEDPPIPKFGKPEVEIWGCDKLQNVPSELHNLTSLSELEICGCRELEMLSSDLHNLTSLRRLHIRKCRRLSCLWEMGFPSTMESLVIWECELLTRLSPSLSSSSHSLKDLDIWNCKNLESLVATADSFPSLESLGIHDCPKLKSLPEGTHRRLKFMRIVGCQNLGELSISVHHFPALETLWISGSPVVVLPNLRELDIGAPMTPDDEQLFSVPLPSSLTTLAISEFKKLSPEAFQNLTSLQSLTILHCPELTSIPLQLLPASSLRRLQISGCPGLTSIPDLLLSPSLFCLSIDACSPLLASYFAKGKGRYWPKVKFIPDLRIVPYLTHAEEVE